MHLWLWPPPGRRQTARLRRSICRQSPLQPRPTDICPYQQLEAALGRAVPPAVRALRNGMSTANCGSVRSGSPAAVHRCLSRRQLAPHCPRHSACTCNAPWLQPRGTLWQVFSRVQQLWSACLNGGTLRCGAPDNPTSLHTRNKPLQRATLVVVLSRGIRTACVWGSTGEFAAAERFRDLDTSGDFKWWAVLLGVGGLSFLVGAVRPLPCGLLAWCPPRLKTQGGSSNATLCNASDNSVLRFPRPLPSEL